MKSHNQRTFHTLWGAVRGIFMLALAATINAQAQYYLTLSVPGAVVTYPTCISGNNIAGYYQSTNGDQYGFLYDGVTYTTLIAPGSGQPEPFVTTTIAGISGNDVVGVSYDRFGDATSFLYSGGAYTIVNVPYQFTTFPGGQYWTAVTGISGNNIVGFYWYYGLYGARLGNAFEYNGSTYINLPAPEPFADSWDAMAVSGNNILGQCLTNSANNIPVPVNLLYNGNYFYVLGVLGAGSTTPLAVSGNNVVGYYTPINSSAQYAFLYNGSTYVTLSAPGAAGTTEATAIDGGNIVGVCYTTNSEEDGFLYDGRRYINWTIPGSIAIYPTGVSGQNIVGYYQDTNANYFGFLINPVSQPPIATLVRPVDNTVVSPDHRLFTLANSFSGPKSRANNIKYEVDIEGPGISQTNDLGFNFRANKAATVDILGTNKFRFHEGKYQWRARATSMSGLVGPWTDYQPFGVFGGVDLSAIAPLNVFQYLKSNDWSFVLVDGFGGRSALPAASSNLMTAAAAGFTNFGVYCFLNFDNGARFSADGTRAPTNQTGAWQIMQALTASGLSGTNPLPIKPAFVAVDVETAYRGKMSPQARVARIGEAVQQVIDSGFTPVIYSSRTAWTSLTANTSTFSYLPLWEANYSVLGFERIDDLGLDVNVKKHVTIPWQQFGGWTACQGKQYFENQPLYGVELDLDVLDPALFGVQLDENPSP